MENQDVTPEMLAADLDALKEKATTLGLTYHPGIGAEKLRERIAAHLTAPVEAPSVIPKPVPEQFNPTSLEKAPVLGAATLIGEPVLADETPVQKRIRMKQAALKLVRIRLTCMNPAKKEWDGEILTTGNSLIGTVSKFIPFNNEDGWHVPEILFNMLKERKCQIFVEGKDSKGNKVRQSKIIREFAIEILDPLTKDELADLAARQAATRAID